MKNSIFFLIVLFTLFESVAMEPYLQGSGKLPHWGMTQLDLEANNLYYDLQSDVKNANHRQNY